MKQQIFEELNKNILLNEKIVFTLENLRDYVYKNINYPKDIDFFPNGIHRAYLGRYYDLCINAWLDDEDNFQFAAMQLFKQL